MKLYSKLRDIKYREISLTMKDHVENTLNLAVETQNRVSELRLNLQRIPVADKIHLHKKTREVIYIYFMKETLKVSKLQSTVSRLES